MGMPVRTKPGELLTLDSAVTDLPRVSRVDARRLERIGVRTVRDLLLRLPFGWESYGEAVPVRRLRVETHATVVGTISGISARRSPRRGMELTEVMLADDDGSPLKVVWFNMPYLARQFRRGDRLAVAGKVRTSRYSRTLEMQNPHHELVARGGPDDGPRRIGGLMPKYRLTEGLQSRRVASWVELVLGLAEGLEDVVPADVRERQHLLPIAEAIRKGHQPATSEEWQRARHRMVFAESLEMQVAFLLERRARAAEPATPVPYSQEVIDAFKRGLPFELTQAQKRAVWDVYKDIREDVPMGRLLNGDVGSGKTAVAAAAVAMVHAAGMQSVIMAPTEILARQHLAKFRAYLEGSFSDLKVELLVSGLPAAERRRVQTAAASGHCALLVGTHALIEDDVQLADLALAIVDEQHRFGTRQRELLRTKAGRGRPHFLAMTATPIPRSLALAVYGEMALSIIDELPPGRQPVETWVIQPDDRERAYDLVRQEVKAGRQAFVICPLIEISETLQSRAATQEFEKLQRDVFPDLRLSLVHGRIKGKDAVMQSFRDGGSDILVATPVIEVGVDVPNATVMLVEGADRFGLAQLHQFRGRVGRGSHPAWCVLLADDTASSSIQRLQEVADTRDGFKLAEIDLRARGAGELMGVRQHGVRDYGMDELLNPHLVSDARQEAERLMAQDPGLAGAPALRRAAERRLDQTSIS